MEPEYQKLGSCLNLDEASIVEALLSGAEKENLPSAVAQALQLARNLGDRAQRARALVHVITDLMNHGWKFRLRGIHIYAHQEGAGQGEAQRDYVRRIQLAQREQQLQRTAVREFVFSMERRRLGPKGWASIFSVIRDGGELASRLRSLGSCQFPVPEVISPYIQVIEDPDQRCEFTGLRLMDIWRYFRHGWSMPYNSVPGRSMLILIRDAAAENHPVMGIAALGSAIVQLSQRDQWIGWTSSRFLEAIQQNPSREVARWLHQRLDELTDDVFTTDFIREGILRRAELRNPTENAIDNLRKVARNAWEIHRQFPNTQEHKERSYTDTHWQRQALLPLFRAKRSETLARLLQVQKALNDCGFDQPSVKNLRKLLSKPTGRRAIEILLRLTKAKHVGIDMLDITICGAVPPYNPILAGKLVAMLMCGPEIVHAYRNRYRRTPSIIASSMAGRAVYRPARLALLGTTSLYGERLNQYHRVQIPSNIVNGSRGPIRYEYLGESIGYGSSHLSRATVEELELALAHSKNGRRVNSIFGEGVSPRLRKIRDGLSLLGLNPDAILHHGNRRLVYGVPLATNFREVLLGFSQARQYILPQRQERDVTAAIAAYWGKRWLKPRLSKRPQVIDLVAVNDIRVPYAHAACIQLPPTSSDAAPIFA